MIEGRFLGYTDMLDGNERGQNVPDVFLLVCSLAVFNGFHLYFSRSFCSFALVNKKKESMKTLVYIVTCVVMLSVISCTSRNKGGDDVQVLMKDSTVVSAPQRMQVSDTKVTITYKGREYRSSVVRRPDESLPVVTDEQGERFIDNSIALRITCGGKQIVDKVFTKESFASLVDARFLKYAILEGLVYDKTTPQGIIYAASICYPQSDLYVPLRLTVSADGKISMAKEELLEEVYGEDAVSN